MRKYLYRELELCDITASAIETDMELMVMESSVFSPAIESAGGILETILNGVIKILTFIPRIILKLIETIRDSVKNTTETRKANLSDKMKNIPDEIKKYADKYANNIVETRKSIMKDLDAATKNVLGRCDTFDNDVGTFVNENCDKIFRMITGKDYVGFFKKHSGYDAEKTEKAIEGLDKTKEELKILTDKRDSLDKSVKEYLGYVGDEWFGYTIEPYKGMESNAIETRLNEISEKSKRYLEHTTGLNKWVKSLEGDKAAQVTKDKGKHSVAWMLAAYQKNSKLCNDLVQLWSTICGLVYVSFTTSGNVKSEDKEGKSNSLTKVGLSWDESKKCWKCGIELELENGDHVIQSMHLNHRNNKDQEPDESLDKCGEMVMNHYNKSHSGNQRAVKYYTEETESTKKERSKAEAKIEEDKKLSEAEQKKYDSLGSEDKKLYSRVYKQYTGEGYKMKSFDPGKGTITFSKGDETKEVDTFIKACNKHKGKLTDDQMIKLKEGVAGGSYKSIDDINKAAEEIRKEKPESNGSSEGSNKQNSDNSAKSASSQVSGDYAECSNKINSLRKFEYKDSKTLVKAYGEVAQKLSSMKKEAGSKFSSEGVTDKNKKQELDKKRQIYLNKIGSLEKSLNAAKSNANRMIGIINEKNDDSRKRMMKELCDEALKQNILESKTCDELKRLVDKNISVDDFKSRFVTEWEKHKEASSKSKKSHGFVKDQEGNIHPGIESVSLGYALESLINEIVNDHDIFDDFDALESFTYETEEDMDKWDNFLT